VLADDMAAAVEHAARDRLRDEFMLLGWVDWLNHLRCVREIPPEWVIVVYVDLP
jgi:hypothetical protein